MRYIYLLLLALTSCTVLEKKAEINPCSDSLFLKLQARQWMKLNPAEFKYFQRKQAECYKWAHEHIGDTLLSH